MDAHLGSLLSGFSQAADRLNKASDSLNTLLSSIEDSLRESNLGLEVWTKAIDSTDTQGSSNDGHWYGQLLGFAKIDGEWCLAVKTMRFEEGFFEGDTSCPYSQAFLAAGPTKLLQSSRQTRVNALPHIPDLLERLTEAADSYVSVIEDAKQFAQTSR